jgi:hypothetical protein
MLYRSVKAVIIVVGFKIKVEYVLTVGMLEVEYLCFESLCAMRVESVEIFIYSFSVSGVSPCFKRNLDRICYRVVKFCT